MKEIRIAVCDDEEMSAKMVADALMLSLKNMGKDAKAIVYTGVSDLLWDMENKVYDLLVLDIDMPGMDGITAGQKIRNSGNSIDIIYVSNREDLVFDTMKITPVCFVRKSHILTDIPLAAKLYIDKVSSKDKKLIIKNNDKIETISIENIIYIEGGRNNQLLYLNDEPDPHSVRYTMKELEDMLEGFGFIRCHKGFIVNMEYISLIDGGVIKLIRDIEVPLSRRKIQEVKEKYLLYMNSKNQIIL